MSQAAEPIAVAGAAPEITLARDADGPWARQLHLPRILYWTIHASCLFALLTGVDALDLALCLGFFWLRMFAITAGYHRYFAHRSYRTSRAMQFALALLAASAIQKGPLWWAGGHRRHHRYSDQAEDIHSPRHGFWHAHQAWIFDGSCSDTRLEDIRDFARFPELVWLNRWHVVAPIALGLFCFAVAGASGVVWGLAISTTLLWHATYSVNSLAHLFGSQRYDTGDDSRNNVWIALLTLGEGWHNNHHHYMASARNGFFWWEIDPTWYALLALEKLGLDWDLRTPPDSVLTPTHPRT